MKNTFEFRREDYMFLLRRLVESLALERIDFFQVHESTRPGAARSFPLSQGSVDSVRFIIETGEEGMR